MWYFGSIMGKKKKTNPKPKSPSKQVIKKKLAKAVDLALKEAPKKPLLSEQEVMSPAVKPTPKWKRYSEKILSRTGKFFKVIRVFVYLALILLALIAAGLGYIWFTYGQDLPDVRALKNASFAETTTIYDRDGNVLYKIYGEENRKYVPLEDATIAIEDQIFYSHFGFDPMAITRAYLQNIQEDDIVQGASTITQQLAKNLYLTSEKSFDRKIKELILSMQIEWYFSKEEILEMYFNKIPYGSNAFGIEAASKTFFDKTSRDLTLVEASILASLPKAPSKFSPYGTNRDLLMGRCDAEVCESPYDGNYVWGRKDVVLQKMVEDGRITKEEFEQAWRDGFSVEFKDLVHQIDAPHFVFYVRDYLEAKYGKEVVESGGLEVKTTLDPRLQEIAEGVIKEHSENGHLEKFGANNAALVAVEPSTGGVLAMVGSVNYWNEEIDGQVNIATAMRAPGSSFKPLVYAAAIEHEGMGSGTILGDYKTNFPNGTEPYIPNNSDNTFKGRMNVRTALAHSRNIPAIKAFIIVGEEHLLEFLNKIGVTALQEFKDAYNSNPDRKWDYIFGPSTAIGAADVTLLQMVGGFATFANSGRHMPINPILEVRDSNGELVDKWEDEGEQAMSEQTAFIINSILSNVAARPGGSWRAGLTIEGLNVAAKTGTSNKIVNKINRPNNTLTIGYTPSLAAIAWAGNSDGTHLNNNAWGLYTAAPMWKSFMTQALEGKEAEGFPRPEGIIEKWGHFYPEWADLNRNFDIQFKPLVKMDCTPEERELDPIGCKSEEEMKAEEAAREEARLKDEAAKVLADPSLSVFANPTKEQEVVEETRDVPDVSEVPNTLTPNDETVDNETPTEETPPEVEVTEEGELPPI